MADITRLSIISTKPLSKIDYVRKTASDSSLRKVRVCYFEIFSDLWGWAGGRCANSSFSFQPCNVERRPPPRRWRCTRRAHSQAEPQRLVNLATQR